MVGRIGWIPEKICQIRYPSKNPKNNKIHTYICPNMARERMIGSSGFDGWIGFGEYLPTLNGKIDERSRVLIP
jgi:hypothetical protein